MLIDRRTWQLHRPWLVVVLFVSAAAVAWYAATGVLQGRLPSGNSAPGLTFGVIGGILIIFECLLWLRKKVRARLLGSAQGWMRAHIWVGLLCLPLLVLHSGFRWGGSLSAILMAIFITVIASGIWGLLLQQVLPARLLQDAPPESVFEEVDHLAATLVEEGDRVMSESAGLAPPSEETLPPVRRPFTTLAAGIARPLLPPQRPPSSLTISDISLEVETLQTFYRQQVRPYLAGVGGGRLRWPYQANALFEQVRSRLDSSLHAAVEDLKHLCRERRQLDTQARLHFWLHNWLWIHLPLSAALVILMVVHAWTAVMYW